MELLKEIFGLGKKEKDDAARKERVAKAMAIQTKAVAMRKKYKNLDDKIAKTKGKDPYNFVPVVGENKEIATIEEKAVSKDQQKLMGMVHAYKTGKLKKPSAKVKKIAKGMSDVEAEKFAKTKHKGLPKKIKESTTMTLKDFLINQ